ncbi:phosphotransferase [Leucobacter allii]|uniref:Phosphotransferase n=1 Tax=Leucobacter allii TaxID=2932247 RepID=A0ABY4FMI6_9MICO|nr:phosphotransferase [Leucobacter allii]UOQ57435.1 phosphotransferase [Leucobacter allii]
MPGTAEPRLLDPEAAIAWLRRAGVVPSAATARARELAGGVSNVVIGVAWDEAAGEVGSAAGRRAVVKQSLPVLRVAERWEYDRARIVTERLAMSALAALVPGRVPRVLAWDDAEFAFAMTMAPGAGGTWKDRLRAGVLDPGTAADAGALLGTIQRRSAAELAGGGAQRLAALADRTTLVQGRTDPFHRVAAERNPDVAEALRADAARLESRAAVLALGDFSPKNLIVGDRGVLALDFEVAHLGDAALDPAFMLAHLVLKSLLLPGADAELDGLVRAFWQAYTAAAGSAAAAEAEVVGELGCLLLARVDGKSPVEYLGARGPSVRAAAKLLLREQGGGSPMDAAAAARRIISKEWTA